MITMLLQSRGYTSKSLPPHSHSHSGYIELLHYSTLNSNCAMCVRFPVPELNEAHRRLPWYHPSLRREVLHVTLSHLTLTSTILPNLLPHTSSVYDAYFTHANGTKHYFAEYCMKLCGTLCAVFLSCDGSVESRELFLTVSSRGQSSATDPSRARCVCALTNPPCKIYCLTDAVCSW